VCVDTRLLDDSLARVGGHRLRGRPEFGRQGHATATLLGLRHDTLALDTPGDSDDNNIGLIGTIKKTVAFGERGHLANLGNRRAAILNRCTSRGYTRI
jgi:hypothetical protein